jgi:hypothetical protein
MDFLNPQKQNQLLEEDLCFQFDNPLHNVDGSQFVIITHSFLHL